MSSETAATPAKDFEETMVNATPNELKQVSAWLQECGRVDAQQCEMDDDKPPISLEKPPFPLEVKKAGSALAIQNYLESLTDVQKAFIKDIAKSPGFKVARTNTGRMSYSKPEPIYGEPWQDEASRKMKLNHGSTIKLVSSTPAKPGDDVMQRAWESAVGSAVKSPSQLMFDNEAYWIGSSFHRNRVLSMSAAEVLHKTLAAGYAKHGVGAWTHNPQTEITAQIMMDRINAGYDRRAGTFNVEVKPKSVKTAAFHAALRKMAWRLSEMGMAFETWCSIGMSVVTGPWEERHD